MLGRVEGVLQNIDQLNQRFSHLEQRVISDEAVQNEGLQQVTQIKETALIIQQHLEEIHSRVTNIEGSRRIAQDMGLQIESGPNI